MIKKNVKVIAAFLCCTMLAGCQTADKQPVNTSSVTQVTQDTTSQQTTSTASSSVSSTTELASTVDTPTVTTYSVTLEGQTLDMEKLGNARQLGGYLTADGKRVKSNVLLRSGKLAGGTEADLQKLHDVYNVTEIIDMRTTDEIASAPDPEVVGAENIRVRILDESGDEPTTAMTGIYSQNSDNPAASLLEMYRAGILSDDMYTSMFDKESSIKGYRDFVDVLLAHEDGAILWHCTGGKDRAGTAAVIILSLLGVDKETILDDFALTNKFNEKSIEYMKSKASELTDNEAEINGVGMLTGVSRELMENVFERAESENGSMIEFLKAKLNITDDEIEALRNKYLEPAE